LPWRTTAAPYDLIEYCVVPGPPRNSFMRSQLVQPREVESVMVLQ